MDPLSITATSPSLVSTIAKTTIVEGGFAKDVQARSDLDGVSREPGYLKTVLE